MHKKFTNYSLMFIVLLNGFVLVASCSAIKAIQDEDVDIVTTSASPNKEYIATIYIVSGGGAAGYVYRLVNIRKRGEPFDPKKGIVFHMSGARELGLTWEDDKHLSIKHSKDAHIHIQAKEWGEGKVQIQYVEQ